MRSMLLLPSVCVLVLALATACSQNPHVDENPAPAVTTAAAQETPTSVAPVAPVKDRDHDGVEDSQDQCPDEPGPAENNGCPYPQWQDHDGDGTPDAEDRCPSVPGPQENEGCPWPSDDDSDHDGTPDQYDRCPNEPGQIYSDGCPFEKEPDSDGDGVLDKDDRCPREAGEKFNHGCPVRGGGHCDDADGDGTPNCYDECPRVPGPTCNRGCPFPKDEERVVLREVKESLKFDFNKATIKESSFPALKKLVRFMKKHRTSRLTMVGHTDEVGSREYNQDLSEARVESVKDFLIDSGISPNRIRASARGETEPLVSTEGKSGRELERAQAINRRVDMAVKYLDDEVR